MTADRSPGGSDRPDPDAPDPDAVDLDTVDLDTLDLCDLDRFVGGFPHDVFARLRRDAPLWWQEPTDRTPDGHGFWVLSGHADIQAAASDADRYSSERGPGCAGGGTLIQDLPFGAAAGVLLNMMDDPRHHQIRRLVTPAVAPRALAAMEPELRARARHIVDAAGEGGSCDFLTDVAVELPLQAVGALMGIPEADRHDLLAWSNATLAFEGRELGETSEVADRAAASMVAYGAELVADRRRCPADDVVSTLAEATLPAGAGAETGSPVGAEAGEPLSDLELLMFFNLLVVAGSETTRNSIALGMAALVDHPDQLEALRDDRSLMAGAVEEILRWTSATLYNRRTVTRRTELHGTVLEPGDKITLWWASANRDERVFEAPSSFDIRRHPNPHLTFGHRSHFCLGANLARAEIRIVLDEVLDRWCDIERTGPIERVRTNKHAGVWHMPVAFRARTDRPRSSSGQPGRSGSV